MPTNFVALQHFAKGDILFANPLIPQIASQLAISSDMLLSAGVQRLSITLEAKVDIMSAHQTLSKMRDGSITASFEQKGKGKVTYSHCQHTKAETQ